MLKFQKIADGIVIAANLPDMCSVLKKASYCPTFRMKNRAD